jgi:hypothetical protein
MALFRFFLTLDFMDFYANKDIHQVTPINHFGFQFRTPIRGISFQTFVLELKAII